MPSAANKRDRRFQFGQGDISNFKISNQVFYYHRPIIANPLSTDLVFRLFLPTEQKKKKTTFSPLFVQLGPRSGFIVARRGART